MTGVISPDVKFSPDGEWLAYSGETVTLKNLKTGETIQLPKHQMGEVYNGLDFSPNGRILASAFDNMDDRICFWDVQNKSFLSPNVFAGSGTTTVAFSPNDHFIAGVDGWGSIFIYDLEKVNPHPLDPGFPRPGLNGTGMINQILSQGKPNGLAFSLGGDILALGTDTVKLYDTANWQLVKSLSSNPNTIWPCHGGLDFSPDGEILASLSDKEAGLIILLWDWRKGEVVNELKSTLSDVTAIRFSPGGKYIACGSSAEIPPQSFNIEILDINSGKSVLKLGEPSMGGMVCGIDFSPDVKFIAWIISSGSAFIKDISSDITDPRSFRAVSPHSKLMTIWGGIKSKYK